MLQTRWDTAMLFTQGPGPTQKNDDFPMSFEVFECLDKTLKAIM